MFYNASRFPPESVDNSSDTTGLIVQEPLWVDISSPEDSNLGAWPDGPEKVQGSIWTVVGEWVVVLGDISTPLC